MRPLDEAPFVDIFSPDFQENADGIMEGLRKRTAVVRNPLGAMVIRREPVQRLLADRRLRSWLADFVQMQGVHDGIIHERVSNSLLATDGEGHIRVRKLVNRAFTPRAVDPYRPAMRDILDSLLDGVMSQERCDFVVDVTDHYPIRVMCHLLGVPQEDHEDFATWNKAITWILSLELGSHLDEAEWGMKSLDDYVRRLIEDRRQAPRDDMITTLVQAEESGDRLSDQELRSLLGSLLFAGFDTTRNQLGLAMWLFAEHQGQWALLNQQPELVPQAVDEVMRFAGAVSGTPRIATEDLEVDGYLLPAGTMIMLNTASANHDHEAYENPMVFDITVTDREPALTFGGGPHYCLGANLAKAELQEGLAQLSQRMPRFALDGEPEWRSPLGGIYGPDSLPLRLS